MGGARGKAKGSGGAGGKKGCGAASAVLLVLCGLPGSGKSTLCSALAPLGWVRISQDELGTRELCLKEMMKALKGGKKVVLDRTNLSKSERRMWAAPAAELGVTRIECVLLDLDKALCLARAQARQNHPTLAPELAEEVLLKMKVQEPHVREGFAAVHRVSFGSLQEAAAFARSLGEG